MSKSMDNYIAIEEAPGTMFGKIMSISDELMWRYFELLSLRPEADLRALGEAANAGRNPRDIKLELAREIVGRFHGDAEAVTAEKAFLEQFSQGRAPEDMPELTVSAEGAGGIGLPQLLKEAGLTTSTSEAMRLIGQGAVRIDGERVADRDHKVAAGSEHVLRVGKRRYARVSVI